MIAVYDAWKFPGLFRKCCTGKAQESITRVTRSNMSHKSYLPGKDIIKYTGIFKKFLFVW